jgi:hypothetical protein
LNTPIRWFIISPLVFVCLAAYVGILPLNLTIPARGQAANGPVLLVNPVAVGGQMRFHGYGFPSAQQCEAQRQTTVWSTCTGQVPV